MRTRSLVGRLAAGGLVLLVLTLAPSLRAVEKPLDYDEIPAYYPDGREVYVPGEVLVKFAPRVSEARRVELVSRFGAGLGRQSIRGDVDQVFLPEELSVSEAVARFSLLREVVYAEPNYYVYAEWQPNDWLYTEGHAWNIWNVNMEAAWDVDTTPPIHGGDPSVVVAISDTGVAFEDYADANGTYARAPELRQEVIWTNEDEVPGNGVDDDGNGYIDDVHGWDFVENDAHPNDRDGHGTHVAGTVAQTTNNGPSSDTRTLGLAFECRIMPLRVLGGKENRGTTLDLNDAVYYAADNGARVLNMSWGHRGSGNSSNPSNSQYQAMLYAYEHGVLLVSSTGNDGNEPSWDCEANGTGVPACYPHVMGVGASRSDDERTPYSEYGYGIEIVAPGGEIRDRDGSGMADQIFQQTINRQPGNDFTNFKFAGFNGTSMASPHVSAAAALVFSQFPELTPAQVRGRLNAAAFDANSDTDPGYDYLIGFGRLDVAAALTQEPEPELVYRGALFDDRANRDHHAEPGDTVDTVVRLLALHATMTNVQATLESSSSLVTITKWTAEYPDVLPYEVLENRDDPFTIEVSPSCPPDAEVQFKITVQADQGTVVLFFNMVLNGPRYLFVDDDRDKADPYEDYFFAALDSLGVSYDVWRKKTPPIDCTRVSVLSVEPHYTGLPTVDDLLPYRIVIWNTGPLMIESLTSEEEQLLADYLDAGGKLFLCSQEYLTMAYMPPDDDYMEIPEGEFARDYLHIRAVENDEFYYHVYGVAGDPITNGLNAALTDVYSPDPSGATQGQYKWWPDQFLPTDDAQTIFTSAGFEYPPAIHPDYVDDTDDRIVEGPCGLRYPADGEYSFYKVVFLAFPFESLQAGQAATLMGNVLDWLEIDASPPTTPTPTPAPTPTPGAGFEGVQLVLPANNFGAGDEFWLRADVSQPAGSADTLPLVVLLDAGIPGTYWFWPSWVQYPPDIDMGTVTFPPETQSVSIIDPFTWPVGAGSGNGIWFYGALLSPDMTTILGDLGSVSFSFHP
jgi:serine protease